MTGTGVLPRRYSDTGVELRRESLDSLQEDRRELVDGWREWCEPAELWSLQMGRLSSKVSSRSSRDEERR